MPLNTRLLSFLRCSNGNSLGFVDRGVKQSEIKQFTSWLGRRSYKARLERFGLARLQEIARENGKTGGRPKGKLQKKGGK